MITLGQTYTWKLLETCDVASLDLYMQSMAALLSQVTDDQYVLQPTNPEERELLLRWSRGYLSGTQEMKLKFPRFLYGFTSADKNQSWIAVVHFTRIPYISGVYCNRKEKHLLSASVQGELSKEFVNSRMADVFTRNSDHTFTGTTVGLYVYQKVQYLAALRNLAEDSKYTPQGSDLKELLQSLSSLFFEGRPVAEPIELPTKGRAVRDFLEKWDSRVIGSLGNDKLDSLLQPVGISAKQWLNAGRRGLLDRLGWGGSPR
jgi:hypothetical protein